MFAHHSALAVCIDPPNAKICIIALAVVVCVNTVRRGYRNLSNIVFLDVAQVKRDAFRIQLVLAGTVHTIKDRVLVVPQQPSRIVRIFITVAFAVL